MNILNRHAIFVWTVILFGLAAHARAQDAQTNKPVVIDLSKPVTTEQLKAAGIADAEDSSSQTPPTGDAKAGPVNPASTAKQSTGTIQPSVSTEQQALPALDAAAANQNKAIEKGPPVIPEDIRKEQQAIHKREQQNLGQSGADSDGDGQPDYNKPAWFWQTVFALAIVIGLMFLLRSLVRRVTGQGQTGGGTGLVEVLARSTIAPKTQVVFLKIQQRVIIAAQSPAGVQTLSQIDDPEEIAQLLTTVDAQKDNSISRSFRHLIHRMDRSYNDPDDSSDEGNDTSEHNVDRAGEQVSGLLGRLRSLNARKKS